MCDCSESVTLSHTSNCLSTCFSLPWQLLADDGPPFIRESPKSVTVHPNQNFTLSCTFTVNSRYRVVWLLDKVAYRADDLPEHHSSQTNGSESTLLVLRSVRNGTRYQCAMVDFGSGHQVRSEVAFVTVVGEWRVGESITSSVQYMTIHPPSSLFPIPPLFLPLPPPPPSPSMAVCRHC